MGRQTHQRRRPPRCLSLLLILFSQCSIAETASLPSLASPRRWLRAHQQLLADARALQHSSADDATDIAPPPTWNRLFRELRQTQQLAWSAPASALSLGLAASELLVPRLRGKLFDAAIQPGASFPAMWPALRVLALLAVVGWALNIASSILFARARWGAAMSGRERLFTSLLDQEPAFFDRQTPGELSSRLLTEPERLESLANRGPERALSALLSIGGSLTLMLSMDSRLALVAVALRAPLIGMLAEIAGRTVGLLGVLQQHALNRANALASEALRFPHAIAAHAARQTVRLAYAARCEEYMRVIRATLVSETILRFTRLGVDSATSFALLVFGLRAVVSGSMSLGALTAFYAYADRFADGCKQLQELLHELYTIRPACGRFFTLLDREPKMQWAAGAAAPPVGSQSATAAAASAAMATAATAATATATGDLVLERVSVAFAGASDSALRNVTMRVRAGEVVALVGPSGAGKSTLLRLLNRLYDPDEGRVSLDGHDVRAYDLDWLRSQFGYVAQAPALFDVSVRENVAFGPSGGAPSTAIDDALDAVGATDFVRRLPAGAETAVGEGGHRLSGGQRQRLAVARALARRPPILLWDEATSSLDGESERLVHAALRRRHAGRTAVIVAHRLSSVLCADRVVVLREGRIEQMGSPSELRQADGWYARNFYPE